MPDTFRSHRPRRRPRGRQRRGGCRLPRQARRARGEGARMLGGAGINTGTIPSKTLRETALVLSGWRSRRLFGVDLSLQREATVGDFMRHAKNVTAAERARTRGAARSARRDALRRHRRASSIRTRSASSRMARRRCCAARRSSSPPAPRRCVRRSFPSTTTASMTPTKSSSSPRCRRSSSSSAAA